MWAALSLSRLFKHGASSNVVRNGFMLRMCSVSTNLSFYDGGVSAAPKLSVSECFVLRVLTKRSNVPSHVQVHGVQNYHGCDDLVAAKLLLTPKC